MMKHSVSGVSQLNDCELLLEFDGEERCLTLNNIIGFLDDSDREIFLEMYDAGSFGIVDIEEGNVVWPGWFEIENRDLERYLQ